VRVLVVIACLLEPLARSEIIENTMAVNTREPLPMIIASGDKSISLAGSFSLHRPE